MFSRAKLAGISSIALLVIASIAAVTGFFEVAVIILAIAIALVALIVTLIHEQLVKRTTQLTKSVKEEGRELRVVTKETRNLVKRDSGRVEKALDAAMKRMNGLETSIDSLASKVERAEDEHGAIASQLKGFVTRSSEENWQSGQGGIGNMFASLMGRIFKPCNVRRNNRSTGTFGSPETKPGGLSGTLTRDRNIDISTSGGQETAPKSSDNLALATGLPEAKNLTTNKQETNSDESSPKQKAKEIIKKGLGGLTESEKFRVYQELMGDEGAFANLRESFSKKRPTQFTKVGEKPRILMVTSNGAGLGHLTRISAIDKYLDAETLIYTMSSAYHRLGKPSSEIMYFPSHGNLGMNGKLWNVIMQAHFTAVAKGFKPDVIVFDGTYVYRGVIGTARECKIPLIWVQRGCWKEEVDKKSKQRHAADKFCEAVIIPGDYGCEETVDVGNSFQPTYVGPIISTSAQDLYSKEEARELLGLPQDKKLFLVQLGAGVINDIGDLQTSVVRAIQNLSEDWEPVLVRNPLAEHDKLPEVLSIQAYPLASYYRAFDAGAFAAGYNTAQESVEMNLPGLFVPNLVTKTDDQLRRAEGLAESGLALVAKTEAEITNAVANLADDENRRKILRAMKEKRMEIGSFAAAMKITEMALEEQKRRTIS